jgi:hypothetical protein
MPAIFNRVLLQIQAKGLRILRGESIWDHVLPARCHAHNDCGVLHIPIDSVMNYLTTERRWNDNWFHCVIFIFRSSDLVQVKP